VIEALAPLFIGDFSSYRDTLVLHDTQASYTVNATADGATLITRSDNSLFSLRVMGVESILFGSGETVYRYSGTPLTGFLTGTPDGNDVYHGEGLAAAMDDLTVVDLEGNDRVLAENRSESGGVTSYRGAAISSSTAQAPNAVRSTGACM
jgi:hypothetical protein